MPNHIISPRKLVFFLKELGLTKAQGVEKLMAAAPNCIDATTKKNVTCQTANAYKRWEGTGSNRSWEVPNAKVAKFRTALGLGKNDYVDDLFSLIGTDDLPPARRKRSYYQDDISLNDCNDLRLLTRGGINRLREADGTPFKRVDFRVEQCNLLYPDNAPYDTPRAYVRITYAGEREAREADKFKEGVVNVALVTDTSDNQKKKILMTATVRPAIRRVQVETVRGFPSNIDDDERAAALRISGQDGAHGAGLIDNNLLKLSWSYTDTGKLADRVHYFLSVWDEYDKYWEKTDTWQLGICLVDPIAFFETCRSGGGTVGKNKFRVVTRRYNNGESVFQPSGIEIRDLFTIAAGNLAWDRIHNCEDTRLDGILNPFREALNLRNFE